MSSRSYKNAVDHLNSLQSNAAALQAVRASGGRLNEYSIPEMLEYLKRIGYTPQDLNALNVVHVAGTKGKGSTSAFTESILRHTLPGKKTGLYTSPHLVAVRERIRVNGVPISEEEFARYFFEVWDRLSANDMSQASTAPKMPGYFRYLTLVAFHTFLSLGVDATVLEVGVGGTYDSTNIVPKPVVTGVTALGIDHVAVLGQTLPEIAWHKAGIYKKGVPALTVEQPTEALQVLERCAKEVKASEFRTIRPRVELFDIELGLAGMHQKQNASLAVALAGSFLESRTSFKPEPSLSEPFILALQQTKWPGRCQMIADPQSQHITWYLDGAHTAESLDSCIEWFASPGVALNSKEPRPLRILVFNCTSGRAGPAFLGSVLTKLSTQLDLHQVQESPHSFFDHVIFSTNVTYANGNFKGDFVTLAIPEDDLNDLKTQKQLAAAWLSLVPTFPASHIHVLQSIEHAVNTIKNLESREGVAVLVTGSLHLVGGMIEAAGLSSVAL